jgi:hypothetical protein
MCRASCYKGMPPSTMASPRSRDTPSWRAASSIFTYLQEFFYFLPCGQNSLRESCGGIWLHESASLFMSCQVPFISILQKPLDTAWYLVHSRRTSPFPRFFAAPGKRITTYLPASELHSKRRHPSSFCGRLRPSYPAGCTDIGSCAQPQEYARPSRGCPGTFPIRVERVACVMHQGTSASSPLFL